ncbi:hypothetical protein P405_07435 [Streptomyces sp. FR-008]|nr:hypothetical protein P405_07435 [Streptomyces sp. FR-008]
MAATTMPGPMYFQLDLRGPGSAACGAVAAPSVSVICLLPAVVSAPGGAVGVRYAEIKKP